jgi:DNA-binding CsgD family transcriptional regulator
MEPLPGCLLHETPVVFELIEALHASLDLHEALNSAYPLLQKLVPAEHGALCISQPDSPMLYDWAVAQMPEGFFREYADIAPHDFVRAAVAEAPNVVVRETEMKVDRSRLDRHPLYQHCLANDMPIEHVMAIMFASEPGWHGGLTLYRTELGPFSDREREIVQRLAPSFANAVANCKKYSDAKRGRSLFDASLSIKGSKVLIVSESMVELERSDGLERLLDRCFGPSNRGRDRRLPPALSQRLRGLPRGPLPGLPPTPWIAPRSGAGLVVSFASTVKAGRRQWIVYFDEAPAHWRDHLTRRELDVAVRVAQGWDYELVGSDLRITLKTVKTHLYRIFNKIGVWSRPELIVQWHSPR